MLAMCCGHQLAWGCDRHEALEQDEGRVFVRGGQVRVLHGILVQRCATACSGGGQVLAAARSPDGSLAGSVGVGRLKV
jgi:hypothetical protein